VCERDGDKYLEGTRLRLTRYSSQEPLNQRTYHADDFDIASVVGKMAHQAITKMLRYRSDKVIAKTRGQIE
jgi:hypothetical protein